MKHNRLWAVAVVAVVGIGLLVGCGGGGGGGVQDPAVGTWDLYAISYSYDGQKYYDLGAAGFAATIELSSNGQCSMSANYPGQPGYTWTGTWTALADRYILTMQGGDLVLFKAPPLLYAVIQYADNPPQLGWLWFAKE